MQYTVYPCLVSCCFYAIPIIIIPFLIYGIFHLLVNYNTNSLCICYSMAASGLPVIHEWSVLIGHEGVARVVYQS